MQNIYGISLQELETFFIEKSEKKFKAEQVYTWLYKNRVNNFNEFTNIKKETMELLKNNFNLNKLQIIKKLEDKDTIKYLFNLEDNNKIEAVLMHHNYGFSLCVSSQVGCNMGCSFCESGRLKKVRNLQTHEMVLQILQIEEDLNIRISHVVLMGIGEPLDNYENVMRFIDIINSNKGINIGSRHITISTCGIIPKIKEFMKADKQVNLAISLHASNDILRTKLMKINKIYKINDIIEVVKEYIKVTNRRVTFEYIMLKDVNDLKENALELAKLLKGINCYVNLIPYNETSHIEYKKSSKEQIMKFYDILKKNKINVTIRKEFGSNLKAACGQLRSLYMEE